MEEEPKASRASDGCMDKVSKPISSDMDLHFFFPLPFSAIGYAHSTLLKTSFMKLLIHSCFPERYEPTTASDVAQGRS